MTESTQTIVITCSKDIGTAIRAEIDSQPGSRSEIQERKNLEGVTAAWIVVATLATQALPHILTFIAKYIRPGDVTKIKIKDGDREIEIENPTPEQVELLLQQVQAMPIQEKING
jgi:hypothetical protein